MPMTKLSEVSGRYGAPMGRPDSDALDNAIRAFKRARERANLLRASYTPEELLTMPEDVKAADAEDAAALKHLAMIREGRDRPLRFYLQHVRLDSGGYDSGGAYWGHDLPLYRYEAEDEPDTSGMIRARNRDAAKATIREDYPNAQFYR